MIKIDKAMNIILENTKTMKLVEMDIVNSLNKVLGEDIHSNDTLPPFDKSAMDGYALKSYDTITSDNEVKLDIIGIIKAGDYYEGEIKSKQAIKIMTGAPLPKGADTIIEIEKVEVEGDKLIIKDFVKINNHIIKRGEEIKQGDLALEKGKIIRPSEIGLLASLGYSKIKIYAPPIVAILATGDELIGIDEKLEKGKIRNSNEYSLIAMIKNVGGIPLSLGVIEDDKEVLKERMIFAMNNADIIISSGGASAGDFDFIEDVLGEIGADIKFTRISLKPGKPVTFATSKEKLFFGLPGNPLSLITTFEAFVNPCIKKIMGRNINKKDEFAVILANDFKIKKGRTNHIYVDIKSDGENYYAHELGSQCSNHLMTLSCSNGIIIVPEDCESVKKGEVLSGKFIFEP